MYGHIIYMHTVVVALQLDVATEIVEYNIALIAICLRVICCNVF